MFDTVAISAKFTRAPNLQAIEAHGAKLFRNRFGEIYKLVLNGKLNAKIPRITITSTYDGFWRLQAEVSIGAWLFGSNLFLPNVNDVEIYIDRLADFIFDRTGLVFDLKMERVTVVDVTKDFYLEESQVLRVIKELSNLEIPKYNRRQFNTTSVYWENKGKIKNKTYKVYSKYEDFKNKRASKEEIELSKGVLRLEIHHGNSDAVDNLRRSLKLPSYIAANILVPEVSQKVIERTTDLLKLDLIIENNAQSNIDVLAQKYGMKEALKLIGHLEFKKHYGLEYYLLPFSDIKKETVRNYERKCVKTGTLSL